ncbi:MAG TPA: HD domain-containing protein [Patescibacteria group bacterium]|nr:HD domain-containing protein [Patescibacteria group bacterium]
MTAGGDEASFEKFPPALADVQLGTFLDQAFNTDDAMLAQDLLFSSHIAANLREMGAHALVVGGFVRDLLLEQTTGIVQPPKDIDIEVFGLGFESLMKFLETHGEVNQVGASFSVAKVTNPVTGSKIDFSIPRKEATTGEGHRDFDVIEQPHATLYEACRRRDLTINAFALDPLTGQLLDEVGGLDDLAHGLLRATDLSRFAEDPLRVLRVMQFTGRFNFRVDPATAELCKQLDLSRVPGDRIGEEWMKLLLKAEQPSIGMETARQLGVLQQLHPELSVLDNIPQDPEWHPEGNVWNHTKLTVDTAARIVREEGLVGDDALVVLFGALCHDLGKATTTQRTEKHGVMRITANGHAAAGVEPSKRFLRQLRMKTAVSDKILPIVHEHLFCLDLPNPTDKQLKRLGQRLQPANFRLWDLVCRSDVNGRGLAFVPRTESYAVYERSLQLDVAEKPPVPIVGGRHLIEHLNLEPGTHFKPILDLLYDAQLGGEITSVEEGIVFYHTHQDEIEEALAAFDAEQAKQTGRPS